MPPTNRYLLRAQAVNTNRFLNSKLQTAERELQTIHEQSRAEAMMQIMPDSESFGATHHSQPFDIEENIKQGDAEARKVANLQFLNR